MQAKTSSQWALVLAVGGVALMGLPSLGLAQFQTQNNTGRALDANNRLGSGGVNDARSVAGGYSADDVVYGDVTRGRQFRGSVSPDPRAFHGPLTTPSDTLTKDSGPGVYERGGDYDPSRAQKYWGDDKGVNAPHGYAQLTPGSTAQFQTVTSNYRSPGDVRMGDSVFNPDPGLGGAGNYAVLGSLNDLGANILQAPDPLSTIQPIGQPAEKPDASRPSRQLLERLQLDEGSVRKMREELENTPADDQVSDVRRSDDLTRAPETPSNDPLGSQVKSNVATPAMGGSINTAQSMRQQLLGAPSAAAKQSSQYAELQKRLARFRVQREQSDEAANRAFMDEWTKAQEGKQQKSAAERQKQMQEQRLREAQQPTGVASVPPQKTATPEATPTDNNQPTRTQIAAKLKASQAVKPEGLLPPQPDIPLKISSFADGVKATGLKQLLTNAEQSMQAGKFTQALDYYDAASAVAPNNPLIMTARSIAELGAGYYARAQLHLEQVLSADPALLMARYDLKTFYGEDRLQYIVRDLKELAKTEQKQSRPLLLLAFIAYSTENEQRAADYLSLAEERGGNKAFYGKLREYWKLPKSGQQQPPADSK